MPLAPFHRRPRAWLQLAAGTLALLWGLALASTVVATQQIQDHEVRNRADQVGQAFLEVGERVFAVLGQLTPALLAGRFDRADLEAAQARLGPLVTLRWVGPGIPGEARWTPPVELSRRMHIARPGELVVADAGQGAAAAMYAGVADGHGTLLVAELQRQRMLGAWLRDLAARLGPGTELQALDPPAAKAWLDATGARPVPGMVPPRWVAHSAPLGVSEVLLEALPASRQGPLATPALPPGVHPGEFPGLTPPDTLPGVPPPAVIGQVVEGVVPPGTTLVRVRVAPWARLAGVLAVYALLGAAGAGTLWAIAHALRVTREALDRELELAQLRANFTAMVSHELKTPVAALRMGAEALRDGLVTDPGAVRGIHRRMASEALRLQRLVEHLLELGQVERGARRLTSQPFPVEELVEEAVAQARLAAPDAAGQVTVALSPGLPDVQVDRAAAVQAIANLVHNALKYGGDPAEVVVDAQEEAAAVTIRVLDRGPGIDSRLREAIFDPYVRVGSEETRTASGSGLGLALVRAYARDQGGEVVFEPRPGGGSVFVLRLPATKGGLP